MWTWINYKRSRTYAKKLELQLSGNIVQKQDLYIEIRAAIKNVGAARHPFQQEGTSCEIFAIRKDLSEQPLRIFSVFELDQWIEPGESINDVKTYKVPLPAADIVWLRIILRVVWKASEWNSTCLIRVE